MTPEAFQVLRLRRAISQAAASKYAALLRRETDGRIRGAFQYAGASRTNRWAGRGLQLQNLKRPPRGQDNDEVAQSLLDGTFDSLYGGSQAMKVLGGAIRAAIAAGPGKRLVVRDLASIESRVLAWVSGDPELTRVFAEGKDPYRDFASKWFHTPYDTVTKEQRNLSKPPSLGCGYGLGAEVLVQYAALRGITMSEEEARTAVGAFRGGYYRVPLSWREVENAFAQAIAGTDTSNGLLTFRKEGRMVSIELPSGRKMYYWDARMSGDGIRYWGMDSFVHKWGELRTWGGKIVENLVQAIARDVLANGMLLAADRGLPVVFHVHDEIGVEVPERTTKQADQILKWAMERVPSWAPGLMLSSSGYISKRMRKD